jgi:hypothetical protein
MPLDHKVKDYLNLARHQNPSRSITIFKSGNIIYELESEQIHLQGKSTCSSNICKFNSTQFRKNMVEIIDDEGFKIVHHKKFSLVMWQGMRVG